MDTKICYSCKKDLPLSEFGKYGRSKDGLQASCKPCKREYDVAYYYANPESRKIRKSVKAKERADINAKYYSDLKSKIPCKDCGRLGFPQAMEFDHVGAGKEFNISNAIRWGYSRAKIDKEIEKCELVCAYCHRIRTYKRREGIGMDELDFI